MVTVDKVDTSSRAQVNQFVDFHYQLYRKCKQWVPPFRSDVKLMLNREKHPFFEHSDGDFFVAHRNGDVLGRLAVYENRPFNQYHDTKKAQFYLFDSVDDPEVAGELFARGFEWAQKRGLTEVVGPKGLSALDGYGVLADGFEHRQMMTMMNYNFPYYLDLLEKLGFEKENEFVSCYLSNEAFHLPEKVYEIYDRVLERGTFQIKNFSSKRELLKWAWKIGQAYNKTFVNNWEYYPLTEREIKFTADNIMVIADPKFIKLILRNDDIVGFLFAFPDVSAALQRHDGRVTPLAIADILLEFKRTKWVSLNGVGVLPEYHGRGGNALLYVEMAKTIKGHDFLHAEQTQMADTAVQVRKDMESIGAKIYKRHRIYHKVI